jgi:hypothetical protein
LPNVTASDPNDEQLSTTSTPRRRTPIRFAAVRVPELWRVTDRAAVAPARTVREAPGNREGVKMSDPKNEQRERDELELEPETIADLEAEEQDADQVRGGSSEFACVRK